MMEIYTIGVYNSTEDTFFKKLTDNQVDLFIDIRQRRGVRGSQYSYVNSTYLQNKLRELGISYEHILDLAPTKDIREAQWDADKRNGETKKVRKTLGSVFVERYKQIILGAFDFKSLYEHLQEVGAQKVVFFCVEENAAACHRSIVAGQLCKLYSTPVKDL